MLIRILDYVRKGIFLGIILFMCYSFGYFCYNPSGKGEIVAKMYKVTDKYDFSDGCKIQIIDDEGYSDVTDISREQFGNLKISEWYPSNETKEIPLSMFYQIIHILGMISALAVLALFIMWLIFGTKDFINLFKWEHD